VHVLSTPLLVKADGTKFGKTESGTVWLDPALTSPYAFYQFWLNTEDRDLLNYLKTFSFRTPAQIEELAQRSRANPAARAGARALAEELTTLVHGPKAAHAVIAASQALFGHGDLSELDEATLADALAELPRVTTGSPLPPYVQLLADAGLVPSRSAARRTVAEGGAWLNNAKVTDPDYVPGPADLIAGRWLLLRRGRRALAAVEVRAT
jgi:tyrosyl-tRNA synthetase